MDLKTNVVNWFEIPVVNMDRAITFYHDVFGYEMTKTSFGGEEMTFFPWVEGKSNASGALVNYPENYTPAAHDGVLIYFASPSGDLANELSRVENTGGKVLMEKKEIGEGHGFYGKFLDSEGNRLAIHSPA
jgi:hypothetical protein